MISLAFKLFDVPAKLLLQEVEAIANVPSELFGKSMELIPCFLSNEQLIGHMSVYLAARVN